MQGTCSRCRFRSVLDKLSLSSVGSEPTHFQPGCRPSQIDLFVTNNLENVKLFTQLGTSLSHHDLIVMSYSCDIDAVSKAPAFTRKYENIDLDSLASDLGNFDWADLYAAADVDYVISLTNALIIDLLEKHAPLVPVRVSCLSSTKPWYDDKIRSAEFEKKVAYAVWYESRTAEDLANYRRLRNRPTQIIRTTKANFLKPKLNPSLGSKALWRNLKNLWIVDTKIQTAPKFTAE